MILGNLFECIRIHSDRNCSIDLSRPNWMYYLKNLSRYSYRDFDENYDRSNAKSSVMVALFSRQYSNFCWIVYSELTVLFLVVINLIYFHNFILWLFLVWPSASMSICLSYFLSFLVHSLPLVGPFSLH